MGKDFRIALVYPCFIHYSIGFHMLDLAAYMFSMTCYWVFRACICQRFYVVCVYVFACMRACLRFLCVPVSYLFALFFVFFLLFLYCFCSIFNCIHCLPFWLYFFLIHYEDSGNFTLFLSSYLLLNLRSAYIWYMIK